MPEKRRVERGDLLISGAAFVLVATVGVVAAIVHPAVAIPITVGAATAGILVVVRRWKNTIFHDLVVPIANLGRDLGGLRHEVEETRALVALQEPHFSIPLPWSAWALPPRGLLEVLKTIQQFEAPLVVDCGSGVSTLHMARAVREIGRGRVIALEQDADWAEYIRRMLERNGLDRWATIVVAPIKPARILELETAWYSLDPGVFPVDTPVDVVVVDGPRGTDGELTRFGALPQLWDRLAKGAVVCLDDTNRADEQRICKLWRDNFPVAEASLGSEHGMSRFTRRTS
jgi:hypothetical protein